MRFIVQYNIFEWEVCGWYGWLCEWELFV